MGMPEIKPSNINFCNSITDIIESVALEQTALSHILNAEGEKLQKIIAKDNATKDELFQANQSVKSMLESISKLEMIFQSKLKLFEEYSHKCAKCNCCDPLINSGSIVRIRDKKGYIIHPGESAPWTYFNSVGDTDNYELNEKTGAIMLKHSGIYSIDWILNVEGAIEQDPKTQADQMTFAIEVSSAKSLPSYYEISFPMIITGLSCGQCLIQTDKPSYVRLINFTDKMTPRVDLALANDTDYQGSMKITGSY